MGNHALLSPSSSHRWLKCTPSAVLETEFENKSSNAAEEGTAAHALCEHKLKKALRRRSKRPVSPFNTDEMEEYDLALLASVRECTKNGITEPKEGFYQYSAAWDSKHKVTLEDGKSARVLFELQEMTDGGVSV